MLKPLKDRVVIQMVEQEEKTAGGLFLPTAAQEKLQFATVLAVSEFTEEKDRQVQVGDRVVFEKYTGNEKWEKILSFQKMQEHQCSVE